MFAEIYLLDGAECLRRSSRAERWGHDGTPRVVARPPSPTLSALALLPRLSTAGCLEQQGQYASPDTYT